jgi:hypothetical protein
VPEAFIWNVINSAGLSQFKGISFSSGRRIVAPVFFNETVKCEIYGRAIFWQFFPELSDEERLCGWFQQDSATAHVCLCRLCPMSPGIELSAVVFGQHVHAILIL